MTADDIEAFIRESRAVCDAATPGPWLAMRDYVYFGQIRAVQYPDRFEHVADMPESDDRENDFAFIAAARTALPRALDIIEAQAKQIAEQQAQLRGIADVYSAWANGDEPEGAPSARRTLNAIGDIMRKDRP